MNVNIDFLINTLVETTVPIPLSGTLSGHAAGEPFDKHAYRLLRDRYPDFTYRQYEFLNSLYLANPAAKSVEARQALIRSAPLAYLLNRGRDATKKWSPVNQFVEKQDDTADILILKDSFANIIDVKTFNLAKMGQPPNIISSLKLARMCKLMFDFDDFSSFDITYLGIHWKLTDTALVCTKAVIRELFKTNPSKLYINWAAALQIQFHVEQLSQDYQGTVKEWCKTYLARFVAQAQKRLVTSKANFIDPFVKYVN